MLYANIVKKLSSNKELVQFLSYFCVGGSAAIVEWLVFALFANIIGIDYLMATCVAFVFSTTTNWLLGRVWTFKDSDTYKDRPIPEAFLVFTVSGIGLLFNLGLMYLFVTILKMNTPFRKVLCKITSTGIVFFWNYLIRKIAIYRK